LVGIALALTTALLFGVSFVFVRLALEKAPYPQEGGVVINGVACLLAIVAAAASGAALGHLSPSALLPFVAAGVLAPGISQVLLVRAIGASGAARAAQVVGATPLLSASAAMLFLGEPISLAFLVGTAAIMCGVGVLGSERRISQVRPIGLVLAFGAAAAFAARDNLTRYGVRGHAHVPSLLAASTILVAATATTLIYAVASHGSRTYRLVGESVSPFVPSGIATGLAYISLAAALSRLRVTVVSPLIATQTVWALLLSGLVLRRREALGRAAAVASLLILAGAALVGATRA
jgi:drug/metabolite transporter (DMT)-like permease